MKRFNGFYSCILCDSRGRHRFQSHHYPHNEEIVMRLPEEHFARAAAFESGDVSRRKANKEVDPEIFTKGVQGYPKIFSLIPNLPLTSPIDMMHQLLKGVAKDVLEFFFESCEFTKDLQDATENIQLPIEFKWKVRSLRELKIFKANELKMFLLYLAPILFKPFLEDDSNYRGFCYLVFALQSLYKTIENAETCGSLLEAFCKNMQFK